MHCAANGKTHSPGLSLRFMGLGAFPIHISFDSIYTDPIGVLKRTVLVSYSGSCFRRPTCCRPEGSARTPGTLVHPSTPVLSTIFSQEPRPNHSPHHNPSQPITSHKPHFNSLKNLAPSPPSPFPSSPLPQVSATPQPSTPDSRLQNKRDADSSTAQPSYPPPG